MRQYDVLETLAKQLNEERALVLPGELLGSALIRVLVNALNKTAADIAREAA